MYFRGFSGIDSPAAMHGASATGFTVSGIFRDPAAFWVLVIFDTDDFYHHPRLKALPDGDLRGVVLEFDVTYTGLAPLDTPKFPTIDFCYLDFIRGDGTVGSVDLSFDNTQTTLTGTSATKLANTNPTTVASGSHAAASITLTLNLPSLTAGDTISLWFENDQYSYFAAGGEDAGTIAAQLCASTTGGTRGFGVNDYDYSGNIHGLSATSAVIDATTATITITATRPGSDANMIRLYWTTTDPTHINFSETSPVQLAGGSSAVTFHCKIDFTALGIDNLRQAWLTFAPELADSAAYTDTTADAVFSNWGITADPNSLAELKVAGPASVRVEETDAWTKAVGTWNTTDVGWFSQGFAIYSSTVGDSLTITYWNRHVHDLWVGTSVYSDRGVFGVTVDGVAQADLDMMLVTYSSGVVGTPSSTGSAISEAISTRRKIASGIGPGQHTVVLTIKTPDAPPSGIGSYGFCYFDFLEAAVASDVPDAPGAWSDRSPAIDYDTQHGYQLAPSRLMWMIYQLGFTGGPIDEYIGVFWWNQRANATQTFASATVDFSSVSPSVGDGLFLVFGLTTLGKLVGVNETADTWAEHFALYINETFSGVWASASASILTVTVRSTSAAYQISGFHGYLNADTAPNQITVTGSLTGSTAGTWVVDPTQTPVLNYGAAAWHADLYAEAASRGNTVSSAFSLEIVNPPDDPTIPGHPGAANTWVCRFADTTAVTTDTGFGGLKSAQCSPMAAPFLAYQKAAFLHVAALQTAAGLPVKLQLGEFLWWFFQEGGPFAGPTGMAYYDDAISADAMTALGRALATFLTPDDDPSVNAYADADFLANRLNDHCAAIVAHVQGTYPDAEFEILYANDVNGLIPTPVSAVGGRLNNYISFPAQWHSHTTAPFQILKLENLAFLTSDRDFNRVRVSLDEITALDWPLNKIRYLFPVQNPGVDGWKEYREALRHGLTSLTPWAFDQVNLIGWRTDPPAVGPGAQIL
jgi:hypothetical protein